MQEFYIMQEKEGRSHFLCVVVTYLTPHSSPFFSLLTPTFPPFTPSDLLLLLLPLPSLLTSTHVHPNNSLVCVWGRRGRSQFTFSLLICVCVCVWTVGFGLTMGVGWSTGWVEAAARFWSGSRSTHHLCVECVAPPGTNTCM